MGNRAPLLSGRPLSAFTPESFKAHVRSLYHKPEPRPVKKKSLREYKVTVRKTKKGLSVTTRRSPKYVTREEYDVLALTHAENELFLALKKAEVRIFANHEEAERICVRIRVEEIVSDEVTAQDQKANQPAKPIQRGDE